MKADSFLSVVLAVALLLSSLLVFVEPASAATDSENTWEIKASMPKGITGGRAAAVDGKIYVMGPYDNYLFDPEDNSWTTKSPMPTPRIGFAIAVCQNKIYLIGGWSQNATAITQGAVYDPYTDTWVTTAPMSEVRYFLAGSVVSDEIYFMGGDFMNGSIARFLSNQAYNVTSNSWSTKAPLPYASTSCMSAVSGGKIYVMGQQVDAPYSYFNQIYDPQNDSWSMGAPMPKNVVEAAVGSVTGANGLRRIYLLGGHGQEFFSDLSTVQVYDPENDNWTYGKLMPTGRFGLAVAVVGDKLYAFGGYSAWAGPADYSQGRKDYCEVYTPFGYGSPDPVYVLEHTPPNVTFESSLNGTATTNSTVPLVFYVDKAVDWVGYSLDGQGNVTVAGNFSLSGLSGGSHSVTVYANDTYGNMGAS
ncbi:MAG: Kelch repeat-containing protein, partial [Candidatus Bathyarchaeia archaeon]